MHTLVFSTMKNNTSSFALLIFYWSSFSINTPKIHGFHSSLFSSLMTIVNEESLFFLIISAIWYIYIEVVLLIHLLLQRFLVSNKDNEPCESNMLAPVDPFSLSHEMLFSLNSS